jgi:hypothetical protein
LWLAVATAGAGSEGGSGGVFRGGRGAWRTMEKCPEGRALLRVVAAATAPTPSHADPVGAVDIGDRKEMADFGASELDNARESGNFLCWN